MRLAVVFVAAMAVALLVALAVRPSSSSAPVPSLHTVWCVRAGYPADLAGPWVVGPGTGLAECPFGERQVHP